MSNSDRHEHVDWKIHGVKVIPGDQLDPNTAWMIMRSMETLALRMDRACANALASFKLPRAFVRVDSLPRNALGKVVRAQL